MLRFLVVVGLGRQCFQLDVLRDSGHSWFDSAWLFIFEFSYLPACIVVHIYLCLVAWAWV